MKCPKCGYTSFDYLDDCTRCGSDLRDVRTLLQIIAVSPEERAPAAASGAPAGSAVQEEHETVDSGLAEQGAPPEDLFEDMDFDGSFDDMVEHTQYDTGAQAKAETSDAGEGEDELLDLDFGELFGEKEKPGDS